MDKSKKRMILVSNRLPMTSEKQADGQFIIQSSTGGLVAGLREIHQSEQSVWVGYSGVASSDPGYQSLKKQLATNRLISVDLDEDEYKAYYNGASNNIIWPLFHYFPGAIHPSGEDWQAYENVNLKFAKAILAIAQPDDQIWVHDYQLMRLPALLRQANPDFSIAYFHHIPFPSSELFRILKPRREMLQGLLGADIIGFHTYDYVRHFLTTVTRILGCHTHLDEILYHGRRVKVVAQPLGVDVQMIQRESENASGQKDVMKLAYQIGNCTVLLGLDRLDYTKGIPERLMAFRQLLKQYPQYIGKVTYIQISVPSRTNIQSYSDLRATVERLIGQINGEFGAPGYTPIQYLYRSFTKDEIIAFYKLARIAIVTPLRDGLNLVCKEYVAARDDDDGVLILSEMAGAAAEMGEALLVNPYDVDSFAKTIHLGLTMSAAERHQRMVKLRQRIIEFDNIAWLRAFTKNWEEAVKRNHIHSLPLNASIQTQLIKNIGSAQRCFIFIDYDNSLNPIDNRPENITPNADCLNLLSELGKKTKIELILMTDRTIEFCRTFFNELPLHIVAEHGALIRINKGSKNWQPLLSAEEFSTIEKDILRLLESYTHHIPGTYVEQKQFSIVWHYRQAESLFANAQARDLSTALGQLLENTPFIVNNEKKMLIIRHVLVNKGYALEKMLHELEFKPEDLLITIGNDESDEDMYKMHLQQNFAIHIGSSNLFAKYHLPSSEETQQLLLEITELLTDQTEMVASNE